MHALPPQISVANINCPSCRRVRRNRWKKKKKTDVAEAKKAVSAAELRSQAEEFKAEHGGAIDLFRRITAVRFLPFCCAPPPPYPAFWSVAVLASCRSSPGP